MDSTKVQLSDLQSELFGLTLYWYGVKRNDVLYEMLQLEETEDIKASVFYKERLHDQLDLIFKSEYEIAKLKALETKRFGLEDYEYLVGIPRWPIFIMASDVGIIDSSFNVEPVWFIKLEHKKEDDHEVQN